MKEKIKSQSHDMMSLLASVPVASVTQRNRSVTISFISLSEKMKYVPGVCCPYFKTNPHLLQHLLLEPETFVILTNLNNNYFWEYRKKTTASMKIYKYGCIGKSLTLGFVHLDEIQQRYLLTSFCSSF